MQLSFSPAATAAAAFYYLSFTLKGFWKLISYLYLKCIGTHRGYGFSARAVTSAAERPTLSQPVKSVSESSTTMQGNKLSVNEEEAGEEQEDEEESILDAALHEELTSALKGVFKMNLTPLAQQSMSGAVANKFKVGRF